MSEGKNGIRRRDFLGMASGLGFGGLAAGALSRWLTPVLGQDNPLEKYVSRGWEKVYRDLFRYDTSFTFLCAPNDTHNCLLRAYVKNGVLTRIGPTFGYGKATDLYGNQASHRWDPRCCQKGLALVRRFYGDRRIRGPKIRKGYREWVKAGFPRDQKTGRPPEGYFKRGQEPFESVSWEEAFDTVAAALVDIAKTYSGPEGAARLRAQGYDEAMIEAMQGAGTQAIKMRGGMPLLGMTRVFSMYRMANAFALLDAHVRGVGPDKALGSRGWDNYSWHTDLPPGHPMVTGQQTIDWDLFAAENAEVVIAWGMNWISTKMPDGHWLTEARLRGTKVIVIACEYSSTMNKADEGLVVRPGTTPALALGMAGLVMREKRYDPHYVKSRTDLPFLVRLDTRKLLRAAEVFPGYKNSALGNNTTVLKKGEKPPKPQEQGEQLIPEALREAWGDFVLWDERKGGPAVVTRDQVGRRFGAEPALEGEFEVTLVGGEKVKVAPVFELVRRVLEESYDLETVSSITWAPKEGIASIAREIAAHPGKVLLGVGMGPNQFFNNDLKDRAQFLLAALTGNIGRVGGNIGSYAGNYRVAVFTGLGQYVLENPFDLELDPAKPARIRPYFKFESAHFFGYGDRPLKAGKHNVTGKTHMPTPTKACWITNSNSILGNIKGHFHIVHDVLPKIELWAHSEWWWTGTCEYADVVFGVDSWAEFKFPDMTASVTNPFLQVFPVTPLERIGDTKSDIEVPAGVCRALARRTGDKRFEDHWRFVNEGKVEAYLQRILDFSSSAKGYRIEDLHEKAKEGIPALMNMRTYPRTVGWEQVHEDRPWYNPTGRLEFYREEEAFLESGENLPVHREPVDSTFFEPNVIVAKPNPLIRPKGPAEYGLDPADQSGDVRQVRHVIKPWSEVQDTKHPLMKDGFKFVFHTPKYRHCAHTLPADTDISAVLFGPFGDWYRRDKRMPYVTEGYVDINPADAKELGVEDGDYVWIDADPDDRPFHHAGRHKDDPFYKISRLLCRARYYSGTPRGVARMWFNMYGATWGSVKGHESRPDGLAKNPETNYQAMFRYGSHQSTTRGWIKPTLVTDTMARKDPVGQTIGKGFAPDVHCPTGAPRESFVKITRAEPGGLGGKGLWRPAAKGLRPTYEIPAMKKFLEGGYIA